MECRLALIVNNSKINANATSVMKGKMSSDATSYSGLEGIVVTSPDPQMAASSDAVHHSKSKGTTECSDVTGSEVNQSVSTTETAEFDDDLPVFIMKFKAWMHSNQLSQRVVAPVLNLSQSHLCDLLNAKKQGNSWSNIATAGRKPYQRMKKVMEDKMILNALCHNRDVFREHSKKKRSVSRPYNPNRLVLTVHQKKILEDAYTLAKYPSATGYQKIATTMGITVRQVKTWFNNRRKLRSCPPSSQDENSYIEPMPESVSRGVIVEEFRVENGDVVAIEPYMSTNGDEVVSLPQNAALDTHDAMGENEMSGETLSSYLKALEAKKISRTEQTIGKENNVSSATSDEGNVIEMDIDSQELKTHTENKTDQLAEAVRNGGHIEVKDGVVVMTRPFPSLGGDVVMPSKEEEGGARIDHDTSPPLNPQQGFGEGLVNDGDRISSTLVVSSEKEEKTVNDDISGNVGLLALRQQSSEKEPSKVTDIQLKFLQLTLEMHGNPSQEILDALMVLTCLEKEQIVEWFKNSLKGKAL